MAPRRRSILRRSLAACAAEGMAAEVVGACCGGAALTGWALYLGMDVRLVGLVAALPVMAQVVQVLGAVLSARFGHRRTALVAVALSRQAFLPLAFLPLLPLREEGRRALLLATAGAHHGLGLVANNAWSTWMGEMVPPRMRGRYFGRRTALCTIAGGVSALAVGVSLDHGLHAGCAGPVLQAVALVASAAGALSVVLMYHQHGDPTAALGAAARATQAFGRTRRLAPRLRLAPATRPGTRPGCSSRGKRSCAPATGHMRDVLRPWLDPSVRRLLAYSIAWNGACGLSAPFFNLFVLRDLGTGYGLVAAESAGLAAAKMATASAWGRAVDRRGSKDVVVVCTVGLALSPLAWLACRPGRLWPLVLETALGGVLLGGHAVASFALPLAVAPRRERPFYLAAIAVAGGAAFALTSAAGGFLAGSGGPLHVSLRALLAGSAVLRVMAAAIALFLPSEHRVRAPGGEVAPGPVALRGLERVA